MSEAAGKEQQVEIAIQRLYTRDLSFESPKAPHVFTSEKSPKIQLDLSTKSRKLDEAVFEVELCVTVTADAEGESIFIAEVEQCGIFKIKGIEGEGLSRILGAYCPGVLFPYVRETIDYLTTKGSFPPLMLAPVNFEALYQQKKREVEKK